MGISTQAVIDGLLGLNNPVATLAANQLMGTLPKAADEEVPDDAIAVLAYVVHTYGGYWDRAVYTKGEWHIDDFPFPPVTVSHWMNLPEDPDVAVMPEKIAAVGGAQ